MGVCPQFDTLWGALTPREHLIFFYRLSGLSHELEAQSVQDLLVKLALDKEDNNRSLDEEIGFVSKSSKVKAYLLFF